MGRRRLGLLSLAVLTCLTVVGVPPAAHAALKQAAAPDGGKSQWARSNTGATHSPKLLHQLAGPTSTSGPVISSSSTASTAGPVAGAPEGVDVASFQHPNGAAIDWSQVAAAGIKFAAVKVTEGAYYQNKYALTDLPQARAAGLATVAYAFAIPNGGTSSTGTQYPSDPVVQADYLINYLTSHNIAVPAIMLDIEYDPYAGQDGTPAGSWCYGLSQSAMVSWITSFDNEVEAQTGQLPIIYTPPAWWKTCTGNSKAFGQVPVWVPDYSSASSPALPAGWNSWGMWQYTSSGTVSGIATSGSTDLDQFNPGGHLTRDLMLFTPGDQVDLAGSGSVAPVTVPARTEEAAPSVTFSQQGLPAGLSLDPGTGIISGTAPAPGAYPVTVTASDATSGAGGQASFTWYAHGTITISPVADQSTVSGTPVRLQVSASDSVAGQTPSFTATGLPPGLSISSAGLITGWPGQPGAYDVTVTATDPLRAATSASFTWTVNAAPASGPTGAVRLDLGGKCLDDSGNRTANGNKIDIWTCNGATAQKWTVVKDQTLRIHGKCLDVYRSGTASGTKVQLYSCNGSAAQIWRVATSGELVNPHSGRCLTDPGSSTTNGTWLKIETCATHNNQKWRLPSGPVVSAVPGKCLDDSGNSTSNGNKIDIWTCSSTAGSQRWIAWSNMTIRIHGKCLDIYHGGTANNTKVDLYSCNGTAAQRWSILASGSGSKLVNPQSGRCLTVPGDSSTNGTALVIYDCSGKLGQAWRVQ